MYSEIIDLIESLAVECQRRYNINFGGCCFFAYCIAKELDRLNIKYKLVIEDMFIREDLKGNKLNARRALKSGKTYFNGGIPLHGRNHYTLKIDGVLVNHEPWYADKVETIGCIKSEDIYLIYTSGSWNDAYNTKNNNVVEKLIIKTFENYEERKQQEKRQERSICFSQNAVLSTM